MAEGNVRSCSECGASIYPEHLDTQKAGYWGGKLVCVHCYNSHQQTKVTLDPTDFSATPAVAVATPAAQAVPAAEAPETPAPAEPLAPTSNEPEVDLSASIRAQDSDEECAPIKLPPAFGSPNAEAGSSAQNNPLKKLDSSTQPDHKFRRHLQHDGRGAVRCRIFHAKLNEGALQFMENQINEWIDEHPDIEVKHVSTQVGTFEGKSAEPHLVITVFY